MAQTLYLKLLLILLVGGALTSCSFYKNEDDDLAGCLSFTNGLGCQFVKGIVLDVGLNSTLHIQNGELHAPTIAWVTDQNQIELISIIWTVRSRDAFKISQNNVLESRVGNMLYRTSTISGDPIQEEVIIDLDSDARGLNQHVLHAWTEPVESGNAAATYELKRAEINNRIKMLRSIRLDKHFQ